MRPAVGGHGPFRGLVAPRALSRSVPVGGLSGKVLRAEPGSSDWRPRDAELIAKVPEAVGQQVLQKLQTLSA